MPITRRSLLGKGALLVAAGLTAPSFVTRTALALDPATAAAQSLGVLDPALRKKTLVVVQLSGGNDGLNTVVPFSDPAYYELRPSLSIKPEEAINLNDRVGLHPNMGALKELYDQGKVAVIQGVGYPNPNRSHFRSMDIWHTARPDVFEKTGWLGKYIEACQCSQGEGPFPAISVGSELNGMFWTEMTLVPAISSIGAFSFRTDSRHRRDRESKLTTLRNIYAQAGSFSKYETLVRQGTLTALEGSDQLAQHAESYETPIQYPSNNRLANELKMVAQVLSADLGTRLFSVSMGGFDTHANQKNTHANLMKQLSEATSAFMQDLAHINRQDDVVLMVFSEFGRRAKENGSGGTDHGSAEPMFVIGNSVRGGIYGEHPSLGDLDRAGDIKYQADFRSVYSGIVKDHLGADPTKVLAGTFDPVALMKQGAV